MAKAKQDIVAQSRAHWELGRLYQTHNKLVSAMSEFQRALQLLEDERAISTSAVPTHQHYELELLFQLGLTAKEMADIFQTDYLDKALAIAQTDRKFLPQYSQISMELGRAHLASENSQLALRSFEAYLRSLIFGQHSPAQPSHTALDISRIDWGSVAVGCYQTGATLRMLSQEKGNPQEALEYGELAREFLSKAQGLAEVVGDTETQNQAHSLVERSALPTGGRRISEPSTNPLARSVDSSSKNSEPDEEEEDWDAELGIAAEEDRPALAHLLVSTSKAKVERVLLKHRLFEAVSNQTFEIVKFPKPTFLYTLMTSSGHSFMHEEELESWLKNVLARHTKGETANIAQHARDRLPFPELLSYYSTKIAKVSKGTKEWSILCVEFCYIIYLHGHLEFCLHSIHGFFDDLRNTVGTTSRGHHPIPEPEREVLFDHSFHLLYLASKLWKPEEDETFQRMMKVQRQMSVQHAYLVDVLAAETYSHHLYHHAASTNEEDDDDDDDVDEDDGELSDGPDSTPTWNTPKASSANGAEHEGLEEARANPLLAMCKMYVKCKHIKSSPSAKPEEKWRAQIAMARALVAIHLHMHGISPLTTARLSGKENMHAVLAKAISEGDKEYAEALQSTSRMRIVEEVYPVLPVGLLKAKAAYALAHHHKEFCAKPAQAEKMYFEAIYILDQCKVFPVGLPPILSELGKNVLLGYADVLITNYKYQYGILCYEAALENLYLRGKMSAREYPALLRRVAAISRDNHDMRRAVVLYKDILHSYCAENKINEVIFVSETLASIHLERGDFALAESYLLAASLALRRNSPQTDRMDPMHFDLQLKQMAPLYLDSFHFERGIELLDRLSVGELSHDKRNRLLADLAGAYIKKEWFDECTQILGRLEVEERHAHVSAEIAKIGGPSKHPVPSTARQMSPVGSAGKLGGKQGPSLLASSPPTTLSSASSFPMMGSSSQSVTSPLSSMSAVLSGSAGSAGSSRLEKSLKYLLWRLPHSSYSPLLYFHSLQKIICDHDRYFELLTRNCYHSGRSQEAMAAIELAIDLCPVSSLFARGHYYYMRGKVLQSLCSSSSTITLHFPTSLKPPVYDQPSNPSDSTLYTCTGDIVQEATASYKKAYPQQSKPGAGEWKEK